VAETPRSALTLHFPFAATELTASDKAAIDKLMPDARKAERIVIAGRTDNLGSDSANQAVALARAQIVRDYLRANLPALGDALVIDARGLCCFIASNGTSEGRKQNRRVEIVLSVPEQVAR
jgi:outer membrane protein OmpA-like peptidoglycan-associated protein